MKIKVLLALYALFSFSCGEFPSHGVVAGCEIKPGVVCKNICFADKNITGASLQGAVMDGSSFFQTNLKGTDFSGASLKNTRFIKSTLTNVNFTGADLSGATFSPPPSRVIWTNAICPDRTPALDSNCDPPAFDPTDTTSNASACSEF